METIVAAPAVKWSINQQLEWMRGQLTADGDSITWVFGKVTVSAKRFKNARILWYFDGMTLAFAALPNFITAHNR